MSVDEIIEEIKRLGPLERERVQQALEAARQEQTRDEDVQRRLAEIYRRFETGWCKTGGKSLSEGIDEALYGGEA